MDMLKKFFPLSFKPKATGKDLLVSIIVLLVIDLVCGLAIGLLSGLPLIGWVISLVGSLIGLYMTASIILSVLDYLKFFNK